MPVVSFLEDRPMRFMYGFLAASLALAACSDAHPTIDQGPIQPPGVPVDPYTPLEPDDECAPADSCEDGDACTENRCVEGRCAAAPMPTGTCCEIEPLFTEDFGGTTSQVTMNSDGGTVGWHVLDTRNASPPTAAYFGDVATMNYASQERVTGSAALPTIELPAYRESQLTMRMMALVETNLSYDLIAVEADVLAADGSVSETRQLMSKSDLPSSAFSEFALVVVRLDGLEGQSVRLRITFDSVDDNNNEYEGVWIDDINVVANCPLPLACSLDAECDDGDSCTTNLCSAEGCVHEVICSEPGVTGGPCSGPDAPADCCVSDTDCDDGDATTLDFCEGATCGHSLNPDTCVIDSDCNDTEACTNDVCADGVCEYIGEIGADCCTPDNGVLGSFDNGKHSGIYVTDNLETGIFWGTDKTRASDGEYSLYCGDPLPQTYAIGARVKSSATTKVLNIPKGGKTTVSFDVFKATRGHRDYDVLQVFALRKGALYPLWSSRSLTDGTTDEQWLRVEVPLDTYAGQEVQVRFVFDSVDAPPSEFEGTYLDAIGIATVCE